MNQLEASIQSVLERLKCELSEETWISRRRYFNQMLKMAASMGITEPCQELYDAFAADDHHCAERRSLHVRCVKLLDQAVGTHAVDANGNYYNEPGLPTEKETEAYFQNITFPLTKEISLSYLIVKSQIEMKYLNLTHSTMGQYLHTMHGGMPTQMKPGTIDYLLKQYARLAKKQYPEFPANLHAHMLRHSIAMAMYKQGIPISYIRDFLGHTSIETTAIYSYADEETIINVLESAATIDHVKVEDKQWKGKEQSLIEFCGLD